MIYKENLLKFNLFYFAIIKFHVINSDVYSLIRSAVRYTIFGGQSYCEDVLCMYPLT